MVFGGLPTVYMIRNINAARRQHNIVYIALGQCLSGIMAFLGVKTKPNQFINKTFDELACAWQRIEQTKCNVSFELDDSLTQFYVWNCVLFLIRVSVSIFKSRDFKFTKELVHLKIVCIVMRVSLLKTFSKKALFNIFHWKRFYS